MTGGRVYFVSDVHLGLRSPDPRERESRFVGFLKSIPHEGTRAVCLLGDIWDFWYEYRDVVPREGARVVAALIGLIDAGVEVWFCPGNHDVWAYSFFESLGMKKMSQPAFFELDGRSFCVGHGDALGKCDLGSRFLSSLFHSRIAQRIFSTIHPWLAFRFGSMWSVSNRKKHVRRDARRGEVYHFRGAGEPLYNYSVIVGKSRHVDFFIFGHFHDAFDAILPGGARMIILDDWIKGGCPHAVFENGNLTVFC